ncbi:MAG TPA: sigma-70 family RNA polymerase sigma factor [Sedimentisphaerales bacterium]|nr:sigma-70 family RNA polymerase sigma factor [Sedimentisphaerales bacterium]
MKSSDRLIEQILVLRCQIGDKDALAELIERYEAPLRYFVNRLSGNAEMAEDILQDTWLTVIRRICSLKKPEALPAWLYRIARNKVYQQLRTKRKPSELDESTAVADYADDEVFSPDDAEKVHRCLKELRPEHKEVLMLRFLEQMSYQQMSEVLNCNLGTVKSRIYYAKLALKNEVEKS